MKADISNGGCWDLQLMTMKGSSIWYGSRWLQEIRARSLAMRTSRHWELDYWKDSLQCELHRCQKHQGWWGKERKRCRVSELPAKFSLSEKVWPQCLLMIGTRAGSLSGGCHKAWTIRELEVFFRGRREKLIWNSQEETKGSIYPTLKICGIFKRLKK